MKPIDEILNKIKWGPNEDETDYIIGYEDRIKETTIDLPYTHILRIEDGFMAVLQQGKEVNIPLHRIRRVKKKGDIIWERTTTH